MHHVLLFFALTPMGKELKLKVLNLFTKTKIQTKFIGLLTKPQTKYELKLYEGKQKV